MSLTSFFMIIFFLTYGPCLIRKTFIMINVLSFEAVVGVSSYRSSFILFISRCLSISKMSSKIKLKLGLINFICTPNLPT